MIDFNFQISMAIFVSWDSVKHLLIYIYITNPLHITWISYGGLDLATYVSRSKLKELARKCVSRQQLQAEYNFVISFYSLFLGSMDHGVKLVCRMRRVSPGSHEPVFSGMRSCFKLSNYDIQACSRRWGYMTCSKSIIYYTNPYYSENLIRPR